MPLLDLCVATLGLASGIVALVRAHRAAERSKKIERILEEVLARFDKLQS